jgi:hypothetical protein
VGSSLATTAARSARRATGSSPRSTALRERFAARRRSRSRCAIWGSRCARACTRVSASQSEGRSAGSPSTSARASLHTPGPRRCGSRRP